MYFPVIVESYQCYCFQIEFDNRIIIGKSWMGSTTSLDFKDPAFYKEQPYRFVEDISCNRFPAGTHEHLTPDEECLMQLDQNIGGEMPNNHLFPLSCIGLLHIKKENNQSSYSVGTCFLIGDNVLLTCAHNLYTKSQKLMHYSLDYYPQGQGEGKPKISIILNSSNCRIQQKYIDVQTENDVNYDYAIVLLPESKIDKYGCLKISKDWNNNKIPLFVVGYAPVLRGQKGKLSRLIQNTIHYSMQTQMGQSGSPIMVYQHGEWKVVGIHTLSQDAYHDPSGIYLNSEVCQVINSWLKVVKAQLCIKGGTRLNGRELDIRSMVQKYNWNRLTTLNIEGCRLTDLSLKHLNGTTWNLSVCKLNQNLITDIVLLPEKFDKLERLYLNHNLVKRLGRQILKFKKLRKVQLNHNKLQEIDQEVIDSRLALGYADNPINVDRSERLSNNYSDQ